MLYRPTPRLILGGTGAYIPMYTDRIGKHRSWGNTIGTGKHRYWKTQVLGNTGTGKHRYWETQVLGNRYWETQVL